MGWRGTTRSLIATARRIDRANKRAAREHAAYIREIEKLEAEAHAEAAVDAFEELCDEIASVHCISIDPIDWVELANAKEHIAPENKHVHEYKARRKIEKYKPGFFDKLLKREAQQRTNLEEALTLGIKQDEQENAIATREFVKRQEAWKQSSSLAQGVLSGEPSAERRALDQHSVRFSQADFLGRRVEFNHHDAGWTIILHANPLEDMPQEKLTLLKSRKLSRKAMPKGELMALHQDNVCGAIVRCAVEFFAILPRQDSLRVIAKLDLLDSATGHTQTEPIVECTITRSTLEKVNLGRLDPSDFIESLEHRMRFMKTKGFQKLA